MEANLTLPVLHFTVVSTKIDLDIQDGYDDCVQVFYDPVQRQLVLSTGWVILSIDPTDGSWKELHETPFEHDISCLCPRTGNIIFSTVRGWQFFELATESGSQRITEVQVPVWFNAYRVVYTETGQKIAIAMTYGDDDEQILICKTGADGSWAHEVLDGNFEALHWNEQANGKFMVGRLPGAVYAWFYEDEEVTQIAGRVGAYGDEDGIGVHARFSRDLLKPVANRHSIFARSEDVSTGLFRWAQIDLSTQRVRSMHILGLDHEEIVTYTASETEIFAIRRNPLNRMQLQLLRAGIPPQETSPETPPLSEAKCNAEMGTLVDFSQPMRTVTFRLRGGKALQMDRRVLIARSKYFRCMLTSGLKEDGSGEVKLDSDPDATEESLGILLRYLLSGTWEGSALDVDLLFKVRALADRYELPALVQLAEGNLRRLLKPENVLFFLAKVLGSKGVLESACWVLLANNSAAVVEKNEAQLESFISDHPVVAKELMLRFFTGDVRPRKRRRDG